MKSTLFVAFFISISIVAESKCYPFVGSCMGGASFSSQFNMDWRGIPTYHDIVSTAYENSNCTSIGHQLLYHHILKCEEKKNNQFVCNSTVESVWYKVTNTKKSYYQWLVDNCNKDLAKKFVSVATMDCKMSGEDPFGYLRVSIGEKSKPTVTVDDKNTPILPGYTLQGECQWRYEIEGWLSGLVITILVIVAVCIILIVVIILLSMKAQSLRQSGKARKELSKENNELKQSII